MLDIEKLTDNQLKTLIDNRWKDSETLWSVVKKEFERNKKYWQNDESLITNIPAKKSKVTDNRIFLALESVISNLTARPSKPMTLPGNDTPESGAIATDLETLFLEKYRTLNVKKKFRKGLRWLFLSRMICLKVIWNNEIDDFDVVTVDPRKVRFSKKATCSTETDFAIEEVDTTISEIFDRFPEQEAEILKSVGGKKETQIINNQEVTYKEAWINGGEWVVIKFREKILKKEKNPYWDWNGVYFTNNELRKFENVKTLKERKSMLKTARVAREERNKTAGKYQTYLFNHFEKPRHPYIFDTMLEVENKPVGQTSLLQQVRLLQANINQRKRQIADNAAQANGRWKADTKGLQEVSKGQLQAMKSDPNGIIYGDGVRDWLTIESGRDLPNLVKDDLILSIEEIDNIFGTMPTFRGEQGNRETATGRAILREQSFQRLTEAIDLVDEIHSQLYNWWMQLIKVRYTETHYIKVLGKERATKVIEVMQDSIEDGIEVRVVPGQILPKDRIFRSERALEGVKGGFMTPLQYFEEAEFENPMETAKQLEMYKLSPFSVLEMDDDDKRNLMEGINLLKEIQGMVQPTDQKAQQIAELRDRIKSTVESEEFQKLPEERKLQVFGEMKNQLNNLIQAGKTEPAKK